MALFWTGFLLSLSLCLDLGIVNVAAMRAGVREGMRASLALGVGSCCGDLIYAALAMAGVTVLLDIVAVRWLLWIGGSAALVWLAAAAIRDSARAFVDTASASLAPRALTRHFRDGLMLALASPSAILWFASVGGAVIATTRATSHVAMGLFFSGFFAAGLAWSVIVAIASARGRRFGAGFTRAFGVISAAIFVALAVKVFITGYRDLIAR